VSDYLDDDLSQIAMHAALGQVLVNSIIVTTTLGHTNLRHSLAYCHVSDPTTQLADAIIRGRIGDAKAALEAWTGVPILDIQARHMERAFGGLGL
jgi:hypothetical protein